MTTTSPVLSRTLDDLMLSMERVLHVRAKYFGTPVILDVDAVHDGRATIEKQDGSLFPAYTHGGWAETRSKVVPIGHLTDKQIILEG